MFQSITAVMPTHNRLKYFRRAAAFYQNAPFQIIVADSSAERYAGWLPCNFQYYHDSTKNFSEKTAIALGRVETPYVAIITDDDFFFSETLADCAAFLDRHPDYSSSQGMYVGMARTAGHILFGTGYPHAHGHRIDASDVAGRLGQLQRPYMPVYYGVHRSEHLVEVHREARHIASPFALEWLVGVQTAAAGKHQMLPRLLCVREAIEGSAGRDPLGFGGLVNVPERQWEFHAAWFLACALLAKWTGLDRTATFEMMSSSLTGHATLNRWRPAPPRKPASGPFGTMQNGDWAAIVDVANNRDLKYFLDELRMYVVEVEAKIARDPGGIGGKLPSFHHVCPPVSAIGAIVPESLAS